MKRLFAAVWLLLFLSNPASAGWDEGLAAFEGHDYATAFQVWLPLAEQGHVRAQAMVGYLYFAGQGAPQDYGKAMTWLSRAANQGSDFAQYFLGFMYDEGKGVPQDYIEAVKWYRRAAEQGYADAQASLGYLYSDGRGVTQHDGEAAKWTRRAAEQGVARAQLLLGIMHEYGRGVPQNSVQAYVWCSLAASQSRSDEKDNPAAKWRDSIAERLTPKQLALAQDIARSWRPKPEGQTARKSLSLEEANAQLRSQVVEVQTSLVTLGYDPGPSDGVIGAQTRAAIRAYQAAVGLHVDGEVSNALAASLKATLARAGEPVPQPGEKHPELYATGTGFVVSREGHVLTNLHVVADCALVRTGRGAVAVEPAAVAAVDNNNDLALLLPPASTHAPAKFRQSRGVRPGDSVVAVGFPLQGLLASSANVATGTVSALAGIRDDIRYLQISAPVQPGNSGGPLLDMSGNVVGVVVAKLDALKVAEATGDIPQNVNFAIKDSVVRSFLDARGIDYETAPSEQELTAAEVGERASAFTVLVECWK